jgi:4-carboxymuconolactone decarboxylase
MPETERMPRIAPLEPPYSPGIEAALRKWMPSGSDAEPLKLFRTLNVHEQLASRMRPLGAGILGHGTLAVRDREIVILRTCARAGAEYEWGVHVTAFATSAGLDDEQVVASVEGDFDDPAWSEPDRVLVALADELHETATVSDALWSSLAARFTEEQLIELLVVGGWYRLIGSVINATGVQSESWAARFP